MVNITENYHNTFESSLRSYLSERELIDLMLPECDDVEQKWEQIVTSYMPDALRNFGDYPDAVLAWMMYIGMFQMFPRHAECAVQIWLLHATEKNGV